MITTGCIDLHLVVIGLESPVALLFEVKHRPPPCSLGPGVVLSTLPS